MAKKKATENGGDHRLTISRTGLTGRSGLTSRSHPERHPYRAEIIEFPGCICRWRPPAREKAQQPGSGSSGNQLAERRD